VTPCHRLRTGGGWSADRIPGVDAHLPEDDDHSTIEASHGAEAYNWLIARA